MTVQTTSETLFERFCGETGTSFNRLPPEPAAGRRTPDYEVHLQDPPVLVEVKQIDPNPEEQAMLRQFAETGECSFSSVPGDRLRGKISKAGSQLRAHARPDQPTMVVVYNNVDVFRGFTSPHAIMAAMYGLCQIVIATSRGLGAEVLSATRRLGGGRRMTRQHNTKVSALAVLSDGSEGLYLIVYHNRFAATPLRPEILRRPKIRQYCFREENGSNFPEWVGLP